jgi:hypothetical protein
LEATEKLCCLLRLQSETWPVPAGEDGGFVYPVLQLLVLEDRMWRATETALVLLVLCCVIVVLTGISLLPAFALSLYLAPDNRVARENVKIGVVTCFIGAVAFAGALYDPVARTPPPQFYLIVGAWLGGPVAIIGVTAIRLCVDPKRYRIQRSVRSLFVLFGLACIAAAIARFVWLLDW